MKITLTSGKDLKKTKTFLKRCKKLDLEDVLNIYAQAGLDALRENTPKDSGKTQDSWSYFIEKTKDEVFIQYTNDNMAGKTGIPVVIMLTRGHATGGGGYVYGIDFINPALDETFKYIADAAWKEVMGNERGR